MGRFKPEEGEPFWYAAKEATNKLRVRHLAGHQRLGMGYSKCGKTIGASISSLRELELLRRCETCLGKSVDEETAASEKDLLRKNFTLMQQAKIKAEEAMIEMQKEIVYLREQNVGTASELVPLRAETARLKELLLTARKNPLLFWWSR